MQGLGTPSDEICQVVLHYMHAANEWFSSSVRNMWNLPIDEQCLLPDLEKSSDALDYHAADRGGLVESREGLGIYCISAQLQSSSHCTSKSWDPVHNCSLKRRPVLNFTSCGTTPSIMKFPRIIFAVSLAISMVSSHPVRSRSPDISTLDPSTIGTAYESTRSHDINSLDPSIIGTAYESSPGMSMSSRDFKLQDDTVQLDTINLGYEDSADPKMASRESRQKYRARAQHRSSQLLKLSRLKSSSTPEEHHDNGLVGT